MTYLPAKMDWTMTLFSSDGSGKFYPVEVRALEKTSTIEALRALRAWAWSERADAAQDVEGAIYVIETKDQNILLVHHKPDNTRTTLWGLRLDLQPSGGVTIGGDELEEIMSHPDKLREGA